MKQIMMREYVPAGEMHQTEWKDLKDLMKWIHSNGFQYAIRSVEDRRYLFVQTDKVTEENGPREQVLLYVIDG